LNPGPAIHEAGLSPSICDVWCFLYVKRFLTADNSGAGFVNQKTHSVNVVVGGASVICGLGCLIMTNTLSILVHSVCICSGNKIRR
jgi:hypothetical protein